MGGGESGGERRRRRGRKGGRRRRSVAKSGCAATVQSRTSHATSESRDGLVTGPRYAARALSSRASAEGSEAVRRWRRGGGVVNRGGAEDKGGAED